MIIPSPRGLLNPSNITVMLTSDPEVNTTTSDLAPDAVGDDGSATQNIVFGSLSVILACATLAVAWSQIPTLRQSLCRKLGRQASS